MKKNKILLLFAFTSSVLIYACSGADKSAKKKNAGKNSVTEKPDTLSNELQCVISIDDKNYILPEDSINTAYIFSDSSVNVIMTGLDGGRLLFTIPNLFKCPGKIPSGYSSVNTKIAGSNENALRPTVDLYSYPIPKINFNNLTDGHHQMEVMDEAAEIVSVQKINENADTKWAEFLIKGKIHTTVLKNVNEPAASEHNKDYAVEGRFVIQTKIYF